MFCCNGKTTWCWTQSNHLLQCRPYSDIVTMMTKIYIGGLEEGLWASLQKAEKGWDRDAIAKTQDKIRRYRTKKSSPNAEQHKKLLSYSTSSPIIISWDCVSIHSKKHNGLFYIGLQYQAITITLYTFYTSKFKHWPGLCMCLTTQVQIYFNKASNVGLLCLYYYAVGVVVIEFPNCKILDGNIIWLGTLWEFRLPLHHHLPLKQFLSTKPHFLHYSVPSMCLSG